MAVSKTALTAQVSCCSVASGSRSSRSKWHAALAGHGVQAQQWQHQGALWDANTRSRPQSTPSVRGLASGSAKRLCSAPLAWVTSWREVDHSITQQGEDRQGGIRLRERLLAAGERPRPPLRLLQQRGGLNRHRTLDVSESAVRATDASTGVPAT